MALPSISPQQANLAKKAFVRIAPVSDMLGALFYARLFELDPALRPLFKVDLEEQAHSLMTMLGLCVEGLDEKEELIYALHNLGTRHAEYGVKARDYDTVRAAFLWILKEGIGTEWTPELENALAATFDFFTGIMQGKDLV